MLQPLVMKLMNILSARNFLILIILSLSFLDAMGKNKTHLDSLMSIDFREIDQEECVKTLIRLGSYYETEEYIIDSSFSYYKKALDLSNELGDEYLIMKSNMHLGLAYHNKGEYEEALNSYDIGYKLAVAQDDSISQMRILNNKGLVLDVTGKFSEALDIYRELMEIGLRINHEKVLCLASVNLSMVMTSLKRWEDGVVEAENAIMYNKKFKDNSGLCVAYNNLSICKRFLGDFQESVDALKLSKVYADLSNNVHQKARFYSNIAPTLIKMEQPDSALYYANKGVEYSQEIDNVVQLLKNYWNQGEAYLKLGQFKKAQESSDAAMKLSRETNTVEDIFYNHDLALQIAIASKDSKRAEALLDSVHHWKDKIFDENLSQDLADSEARYENEKLKNDLLSKEKDILAERTKRNNIVYGGLGILGLILISYVAAMLWFKNRNRKEKLRIEESFNQELINEIDQYRRRVSRTLHDDLGQGILEIKQALTKKKKTLEISNTIDKLSDHIRALSRDQYPYQIDYVGFENSLSELFENIEETTELNISDDFRINATSVDNSQAKHLFYVIQELISNSLKHSNATKVGISLQEVASNIQLKYLENGKFFNFREELKKTKHLGLKLIKHRVRILDGNILYNHNSDGLNEYTINIPKNLKVMAQD